MACRRYVAMALTMLLLSATAASAYEDDTHYLMTYVICRTVGFTPQEALVVASADVAMDDSDSTVAAGTLDGKYQDPNIPQAHVDASWMWHAIAASDAAWNSSQGTSDILKQKNLLFQLALDKWLDPSLDAAGAESWQWQPTPSQVTEQVKQRLFWLGVFFHYQQDTWAHRRPGPRSATRRNWESYQTPFGHVNINRPGEPTTIHEPDRPPWHPIAALRNLQDGIIYANTFLRAVLNRRPNPNFIDFDTTASTDRDDKTWPRRKEHFNQLSKAATTPAGKYMEALIRAQIDTYTIEPQTTGVYQEKWAAQANLVKTMLAFAKVWQVEGREVGLNGGDMTREMALMPLAQKDRMYSTSLNTNELVAKMGPWQDVLGFPTTAVVYAILHPSRPNPSDDLQKIIGWWAPVSNDGATGASAFVDVSTMNARYDAATGTEILAVGSDGTLWRKPKFNEAWQPVPNSAGLIAAKMQPDGTILGITSDLRLATKASLKPADPWKPIQNSAAGTVKNLTVKRDGTIVGVGPDGQLQTARLNRDKSQLENGWQPVPVKDVPVVAVAVMPDQDSFLGVSPNGVLLYKRTLGSPWKRAPNSNAFFSAESYDPSPPGGTRALGSVTMLPDGTVLGIRKGTAELLVKRTPGGSAWPQYYSNPDAMPDFGWKSGQHLL